MANPEHLAEAFLNVVKVNHYMVDVVHQYNLPDLYNVEQILIDKENHTATEDPELKYISPALDLVQHRINAFIRQLRKNA